jgi:ribosomal protein S18 acetylase RimI-like enzyme
LNDVTFRAGTRDDAGAIQALLQELADHDGVTMRGSRQALLRHGFGPRPLFQTVLAIRKDTIVGLALFYPDFSTLRGQPGVYVQDLYVVPAARGLGLGARLLGQVRDAAQEWGATYVSLIVDRGNRGALGFYRQIGFADRGDYDLLVLEGPPFDRLGG